MAIADMRTGIFFCNCEGKFSDSLDFNAIKKQIQLDAGEIVQEVPGLCKDEGQYRLSKSIGAAALNGLVIAGCREDRLNKHCLHTARQHGIGAEKLTFVNLQDLCVNVHPPGPELNGKAARMTQQALVYQRLQSDIGLTEIAVTPVVLVIGSGDAARLAAQELVGQQPVAVLGSADRVRVPGATYYEDCKLERVEGNVGSFLASLQGPRGKTQLQAGGIVLALETPKMIDPCLGIVPQPGILPLSQISSVTEQNWSTHTVAFLLGDGENQALDSSAQALNQALELRKYGAQVEFFYRHMQVAGEGLERVYRLARKQGVKFNRYHGHIDVHTNVLGITLKYCDASLPLPKTARVLVDYLFCGEVYFPSPEGPELARLLQVDLGPDGFFQTENVHLLPGKSNRPGIYFVGPCHRPACAMDSLIEAQLVAADLAQFAEGPITVAPLQAAVDAEKCALCLTCYRTCAHKAVEIDYGSKCARINPLACQRCGTCAAECPAKAIELPRFSDKQLLSQLELAGKVVAFACENSGYPAAELAGLLKRQYPVAVELIKVPCAGKIDALYILRALEQGAWGVLLLACHPGGCKSLTGNTRAQARMTRLKELVSQAGLSPHRVHVLHLAANTGHKFAGSVHNWLSGLGPIDREGDGT